MEHICELAMSQPGIEERVWFSYWTTEYIVKQGIKRRVIEWLEGKPPIRMDWDNCTIDILGKGTSVKLAIRSKTLRNSKYMGNIPVQLRYMLEVKVDVNSIAAPTLNRDYSLALSSRKSLPASLRASPHDRWLLKIGEYEIWQWTRKDDRDDGTSTLVYRIYESLLKFIGSGPVNVKTETGLRLSVEEIDTVVPIVYQPAVDSLNNFLREVHCFSTIDGDTADVQVSLVFNNEQLRKFALADGLYRWWRKLWYGRTIDIETFRIHFVKDKLDEDYFLFQGIYSGDYDLEYDAVHLDLEPRRRSVERYFGNQYHPVVFVNTSNHAFAEHDNNGRLWKWEYIPWIKGSPVKLGAKSRDELDKQFRSAF